MKCKKCGKKAVTSYPEPLCREHYIEYYKRVVEHTINKFKMFKKDDKILVAVSGGKDSAALAKVLDDFGYDFEGLYINLGIENYSDPCEKSAKELFKMLGKKLNIVDLRREYGLEVKKVGHRPVCSVCGVYKRYIMNKFAYENGFTVVATAHNISDLASFYFMNIKSGNIEYIVKQRPVLEAGEKMVKKVKPLFYLTEKENMLYSILNNLPVCHLECPNAVGNTQIKWKKVLYSIESEEPGFMKTLANFIIKTSKLLKNIESQEKYQYCKICGYPTGSKDGVCAFCKIKMQISKSI